MKSSYYLFLLSSFFMILAVSGCKYDSGLRFDYFSIRNSSSDTIVAILHNFYPDTMPCDEGESNISLSKIYPTQIIAPNKAQYLYATWDKSKFIQISIFSIEEFHAAGDVYKELFKYPMLGRFTFNGKIIEEYAGTTFYYPPCKKPTVSKWIDSWEEWYQNTGFGDKHVDWPYGVPFYTGN